MIKKLIKTILITGIFSLSIVQAEQISSIEITGLNAISRGTVLNYLPVEVGDDYNQQNSSKIIDSLYKTSFFKDVEVSQINKVLKIKLIENPSIKYIDILNYSNKVIEKEALDKVLQSIDLVQGSIFSKRRLDKLISQLESDYIAKGYYNVKINKEITVDTNNRVDIKVDIDEGEVARIGSMKITGSVIHSEDDLLDLFKIGEPDFFLFNYFTQKDNYSKLALDAGIEDMKSLYLNNGYLDFKVNKVITELSDDKKKINIEINISEGNQHIVGEITFSGNLLDQSVKDLKALLSIKSGDVFKRKKAVESAQKITDIFTDKGYAFSSIDAIPTKATNTHTIDVNINITLNQRVYINRITITGNTRTQDDVVRREIKISEGGLYSNSQLNESVAKIKRLGYFSDVKMEVSKVPGFPDKINLHFTVQETKTGQFTIGLSQSSGSGVSFNFGIQERNFLGTGNTLNATLRNSDAVKEAAFYFSNPYFTKDGHSLNYGVFSKSINGSELESGSYTIDETGVSVGYGIPITKSTRISSNLKLSQREISCGSQLAGRDDPDTLTALDVNHLPTGSSLYAGEHTYNAETNVLTLPAMDQNRFTPATTTATHTINDGRIITEIGTLVVDVDDGTETLTVGINDENYRNGLETAQCARNDKYELKLNMNWSSNTLNDYAFPTKGQRNQLSLDLALPILDFSYYKFNASHKSYRKLNNNFTLGINSKFGIAGGYAGNPLPFFERYYGGGSSSVRGFDFNSLGPRYLTDKAKGGELSLLVGSSLISKVPFIDDSKNMRVSAFFDVGSISEKSLKFNDMRASTGVAFTWLTPIGPLGFYLAEPVVSKSGDDVKTFDFSLGSSF